jgi:AdoMet-dependent heme synthase
MVIGKRWNIYPGAFRSLKRLNGLPLSRKAVYLTNAFLGEVLRLRTLGSFGLRLVEISLTDRCQCRCLHCFAANEAPLHQKAELSTAQVTALLDELVDLGIPEVCFSGGEPLLRKDILKLIAYAHRKGLVVRLITNGILLNEELIAAFKEAGLNWCSTSIDSPKPEEHDRFRGYPGCFEKSVNGLRLLLRKRIPCSIITVARRESICSGDLERIVKLGLDLGVTVVRINFPIPIGRFKGQEAQVLDREEREEVRKLLR